jgi:hypothetical protein
MGQLPYAVQRVGGGEVAIKVPRNRKRIGAKAIPLAIAEQLVIVDTGLHRSVKTADY